MFNSLPYIYSYSSLQLNVIKDVFIHFIVKYYIVYKLRSLQVKEESLVKRPVKVNVGLSFEISFTAFIDSKLIIDRDSINLCYKVGDPNGNGENRGFLVVKLKSSLLTFYTRHYSLVNCYRISLSQIITDMFPSL